MIEAINPIDGSRIASYDEMSPDAVKRAIAATNERFLSWRTTSFAHRAERMRKAGRCCAPTPRNTGGLMALEMGKPIKDGIAEANKSALGCDYYADHAEKFLTPEIVPTDAKKSYVAFQPLGVILAVMPWNFPFWQVFRAAAPALMAGNAMVLKHASNVPGCALAIEKVFAEAGFPDDLFRTLDDRLEGGGRRDRASAGARRDADRLDGGGPRCRREGRAHAEKDGARARRQRRLCRSRRRRYRAGGARSRPRGGSSIPGRAASRPSASSSPARPRRGSRPPSSRQMGAVKMGDPLDESNAGRAAGAPRSARRPPSPGAGEHRQGRHMPARRQHPEQQGRVLSADGADRCKAGHAGL